MNEDKRFKQINRIATPIKVNDANTTNNSNNQSTLDAQIKDSISAIPPKKEVKKIQKKRKKVNKERVLQTLIIIFVIGIIASSIYLLIPETISQSKIKYNDISTTTTIPNLSGDYFENIKLNESLFIDNDINYKAGNFTIRKVNNNIYINDKEITKKEYFYSSVGLIDDLIIFTAKDKNNRTTEMYIVDSLGNTLLNMYHIGDINGMVISDEDASVIYNSEAITIVSKNVIGDKLIPNNNINSSNPVSICNEDDLFASSIETSKPVIVHYSLSYKGNHEFNALENIYEKSLEEYKNEFNYCK